MIKFDVRADIKGITKQIAALAQKQIPFATAQALTATAKLAAAAENEQTKTALDRPNAFTQKAMRAIPATKKTLTAKVIVLDKQARYLAPEISGGRQVLNRGRAVLSPKAVRLNQFGNIPKGTLARLNGKSNIFIGSVTFSKSGQTISGVWERPPAGQRRNGGRGTKGKIAQVDGVKSGLKLLVRMADPVEVKTRLPFGMPTSKVVAKLFPGEMRKALDQAMKTAR